MKGRLVGEERREGERKREKARERGEKRDHAVSCVSCVSVTERLPDAATDSGRHGGSSFARLVKSLIGWCFTTSGVEFGNQIYAECNRRANGYGG